jgi:hypothetical protein
MQWAFRRPSDRVLGPVSRLTEAESELRYSEKKTHLYPSEADALPNKRIAFIICRPLA